MTACVAIRRTLMAVLGYEERRPSQHYIVSYPPPTPPDESEPGTELYDEMEEERIQRGQLNDEPFNAALLLFGDSELTDARKLRLTAAEYAEMASITKTAPGEWRVTWRLLWVCDEHMGITAVHMLDAYLSDIRIVAAISKTAAPVPAGLAAIDGSIALHTVNGKVWNNPLPGSPPA